MNGRTPFAAAVAAAAFASSAAAQTPDDWKWVTDETATLVTGEDLPANGWRFVAMPPGWHVTMGPGGILFDPAFTASDRFSVEVEIFLFPGDSDEGYGAFAGGHGLDGEDRSYIAFLARGDGSAGIFRYTGNRAEPLIDWKHDDAVAKAADDGTARNVIRIEVERDAVVLRINGTEIASLPREQLALDGHVGLRIGRGINIHASAFDITHHLAPAPPPSR